jgi:hypothetical protein
MTALLKRLSFVAPSIRFKDPIGNQRAKRTMARHAYSRGWQINANYRIDGRDDFLAAVMSRIVWKSGSAVPADSMSRDYRIMGYAEESANAFSRGANP